jgi:hypothetical protein
MKQGDVKAIGRQRFAAQTVAGTLRHREGGEPVGGLTVRERRQKLGVGGYRLRKPGE